MIRIDKMGNALANTMGSGIDVEHLQQRKRAPVSRTNPRTNETEIMSRSNDRETEIIPTTKEYHQAEIDKEEEKKRLWQERIKDRNEGGRGRFELWMTNLRNDIINHLKDDTKKGITHDKHIFDLMILEAKEVLSDNHWLKGYDGEVMVYKNMLINVIKNTDIFKELEKGGWYFAITSNQVGHVSITDHHKVIRMGVFSSNYRNCNKGDYEIFLKLRLTIFSGFELFKDYLTTQEMFMIYHTPFDHLEKDNANDSFDLDGKLNLAKGLVEKIEDLERTY